MKRDKPIYVGQNSPRLLTGEDLYDARLSAQKAKEASYRRSQIWSAVKKPLGVIGLGAVLAVSFPKVASSIDSLLQSRELSRVESVMNQDVSQKSYADIQSTVYNLGLETQFYSFMSESEKQMPPVVFEENFDNIARNNFEYALKQRYETLSQDNK